MPKHQEISQIFKKAFDFEDFEVKERARSFHCCYKVTNECDVSEDDEPIWTSRLGPEETNVMVVGEAPSPGDNNEIGAKIAGIYRPDQADESEGHAALRCFVQKYYQTTPYMADLAKCGVRDKKNANDKKKLKKRFKNCPTYLLIDEINIMQPEYILCVGVASFNKLSKARFRKNFIRKDTKLIKLAHFSTEDRRFSLKEKELLIWPIQPGKMSTTEVLREWKAAKIEDREHDSDLTQVFRDRKGGFKWHWRLLKILGLAESIREVIANRLRGAEHYA